MEFKPLTIKEIILLHDISIAQYGGATGLREARFEAWVNKRVLPHQEVICSAVDLYAARSGMLHRLGTRSRLSESGEAQISFCHGNARFEALRAARDLYSEKTGGVPSLP